jgi:hypothetical protein
MLEPNCQTTQLHIQLDHNLIKNIKYKEVKESNVIEEKQYTRILSK